MIPSKPAASTPSPRASRGPLLLLALFALGIRLVGLDFDQNHFFHPDERAIGDAILKLSFHPLQLNPHFFAYGSLPFYLTKALTSLLAQVSGRDWFSSYDGVVHAGRFLSALAGALTVLLLAAVGRRLYGQKAGLLAGLLLTLAVLHVQTSHFASTDVTLTLFVLLALAASARLANRGRGRDALLAGVLTGFAVATKASAAPLLLPLAVAVFLACRPARAWRKGALLLTVAGLATSVAFFLGEPYAFLDFHEFWRSVSEQGAMVRHAGLLPYTNQYIGVPNFLYEAKEIVLWGLGPFFGLAALWAAGRRLARFRALSPAEWVFASFFVPFVLLTCTFEVKFPRYLLPVYPLLALWAAAWLTETAERGRAGRLLRAVVVGGTAAWALAFASIYTRPHSSVTASLWFHDHVPEGARVLEQDWDEGFPFSFPGRPAERYKIVAFGFYENDSPEKMTKLARELAGADWVVLQTKRLYGAVTRAPEKFPLTNRAFRLLFAGDLGFALVREVASRPSLLGVQVPDELADESFTVYDHPKVVFFQNVKRLSAEAIEKALLSATPSKTLTRDDLLLAHPAASAATSTADAAEPGRGVPGLRSSFVALPLFAAWLELMGLAGAGLLAFFLPARAGRDALGRVTGVLLFAFVPWLLVVLRLAPFSRGLLVVTTLVLLVAGFLCRGRAREATPAPERRKTALVFWGTFLFFLAVRALNPEIYSGEKPMDFSFLNTLLRSTELPPPEPWLAGTPLSYTYFGHFLAAAAGKLLGIHPGLLFNLAIAMTAALSASAILAGGAALGGRLRTGAVAVLLALFVAAPSGPRTAFDFQFHQAGRALDWHYFWATSRVIAPNAINEYPFWSFLFADLHAHVLALPFTAAFVAALLLFVTREDRAFPALRQTGALVALAALFFAALQITSGWSTPVYACLLLFLPGVLWLGTRPPGLAASTRTLARGVLLPAAGVALSAALLVRPFWAQFSPPPRNWGREVGPWAQPWDFLNVWAFFVALLVPFAFAAWKTGAAPRGRAARAFLILAAVALPLSVVSFSLHPPGLAQASSVRLFTGLAFLVALGAALRRATEDRLRPALTLAAFGFAVLTGCELVFVWDRMNTVFKFHFETWLLFSLAGALAWETFRSSKSRAWRVAIAFTGLAALFTTVTALAGFLRLDRGGWPRFTLDGTAYLERQDPSDRGAIEWINANVRGLPVLLEAQGPPYQEFTRLCMHTGLPTVQGWEYHTQQRGHSQAETDRRKQDVTVAYTSADEEVVKRILLRYHVALVAVGNLERRTYAGGNLVRFESWTDLLTPVYRNPEIVLFAVKGVFSPGAAAAPVRVEELPLSTRNEEAPPPADAAGRVRQPRGAASDASGRVWVADFGNQRVQLFGEDGSSLLAFGARGSGPGQFNDPCGIAVGPSGLVFVADTWNGRVQVFDDKGGWLREWGGGFFGPRGIAVDTGGTVFLSDTGNGRVVRFDGFGHKEAEWGTAQGPGKLADPQGLVAGVDGNVYVADNGNGRVAIFDRDGAFLRAFEVAGWRREVLSEPYLALDSKGHLWVSVPLAGEVRAYTKEGRLVTTLRGADQPEGRKFEKPSGLALLPGGRLFVADLEGRFAIVPLPK